MHWQMKACVAAATLWSAMPAAAQPPITVLQSFDGLAADGVAPPNTSGNGRHTQFVQWVNDRYAIYDKTTGAQIPAPSGNWLHVTAESGPCSNLNSGQPMVEYDKLAARWVLAQLAFSSPAYYFFAGVPPRRTRAAQFNLYAFAIPAGLTPNTPRLAVSPEAYYASFNVQQAVKTAAPMVMASDRTNMLAGQAARGPVELRARRATDLLPSDFDGAVPPPPGTPDFYMGVGASTYLSLFAFHVDFASPGNSTFTALPRVMVQSAGLGCTRNPPQWAKGSMAAATPRRTGRSW